MSSHLLTLEEEAPPPNGEAEEGDEQRKDEKMSEKLSNISSEDIEMASAKEDSEGEDGGKGKRVPSTGSPGEYDLLGSRLSLRCIELITL